MDIETMAQKIAELWRSQDTASHALGLSFLHSQTEGWQGSWQYDQLIKLIVRNCINTDEFRNNLNFSNAGERIKQHFTDKLHPLQNKPNFYISEWSNLISKGAEKFILIDLGGYLKFQVSVEMKNPILSDYFENLIELKVGAWFPNVHLQHLQERFFYYLHKAENYIITIKQNLPNVFFRAYLQGGWSDICFNPNTTDKTINLIVDCFMDNYKSGSFQFYDPLF
jgi:hypothetical protein